jgi:hypothetical protein
LAFPEVAFTFLKDGRTVWQLPAVKRGTDSAARLAALRERLRALYGADEKLLPVDFSVEIPLNALMMPTTVPNRPTKGAVEPIVARPATPRFNSA